MDETKITCDKDPVTLTLQDMQVIEGVINDRLTYLSRDRLQDLARCCKRIELQGTRGIFVEAGCGLGGSAVVVASLKASERRFSIYDIFGMIPPPTEDDGEDVHLRYQTIAAGNAVGIGGDKYYGYEGDLFSKVKQTLVHRGLCSETHHITLTKGPIREVMEIQEPVAFAHVDVDWYDSVLCCLEQIVPWLSVGGIIIIDDYNDWSGCRKAVDSFFRGSRSELVVGRLPGNTRFVERISFGGGAAQVGK